MPKRSKTQIEKDETKILKELEKNANKSINEIAKKCGFSRQKVWRIIKRLEKDNTIWGYVTLVDKEFKGSNSYIMLVKRTTTPITKDLVELITKRKLEKAAEKYDVILDCSSYTNGAYDWVIHFSAIDIKHAKRFVEEMNHTYHGFIKEIILLEDIFLIKRCGLLNPELERLHEFYTGR